MTSPAAPRAVASVSDPSRSTARRSLADALSLSDEPRLVTSSQPPFHIVHTNKAWCEATGYTFTDVVGKSCTVLHGPSTDESTVQALKTAFATGDSPCSASLICYRKDGTPFMKRLYCELVGNGTHWLSSIAIEAAPATVARVPRPIEERAPLLPVNYAEPDGVRKRAKRAHGASDKVLLPDLLDNHTDPMVLCSAA